MRRNLLALTSLIALLAAPAVVHAVGAPIRSDTLAGREHLASNGPFEWMETVAWTGFGDWRDAGFTVLPTVVVKVTLSVGMTNAPSYYEDAYNGPKVIGRLYGVRSDGSIVRLANRVAVRLRKGRGSATRSFAATKMRDVQFVVFEPTRTRRNEAVTGLYWCDLNVYRPVIDPTVPGDREPERAAGPPHLR